MVWLQPGRLRGHQSKWNPAIPEAEFRGARRDDQIRFVGFGHVCYSFILLKINEINTK